MFGALKPGFRRLATLKLVMNVVGEPKRTAAASRGFLATARLSCSFSVNEHWPFNVSGVH